MEKSWKIVQNIYLPLGFQCFFSRTALLLSSKIARCAISYSQLRDSVRKKSGISRSEIQSANNPADAHGDIGGLSRCRCKMVTSGLCAKMNQNVQRPLAVMTVPSYTPTMYVFSIIASYILTTYMQPIETL